MSLSRGARIGSYEVTGALGAGGMGEVYRARDTRLDRDVALKVIPDLFAGDAERLSRFQREAKVLAALNHPNIAAIYGIEDASGTRALVMELVDGRTLQELIGGRPLTLDDALPIARQIAEALAVAHAAGVIHRDLKPANIKVRSDGTVKVLDFGLAKAFAPEGANATADVANSPTFTASGTELGTILGTAAYMSPEQARGKAVDKRADLWAFGCVLFEMLTGKRAFAGETTTDILAAVVRAEPDWSSLPAATPQPIRTLLRRCLAKEPAQRLGDASAARLEIDDARSESSGSMSSATVTSPPTPTSPRHGRERLAWIVASTMTIVAIIAAVIAYRRPAPIAIQPAEVRFQIDEAIEGVLSPDGTAIVCLTRAGFVLRTLATGTTSPLPALTGAYTVFWSPNGQSLGFLAAQKLKRLDLASNAVQTLADAATPRGGTWAPDGTILFAPGGNGPLYRTAAAGGTPAVQVTDLQAAQTSHRHPAFLPDGRHFIFWVAGPSGVRGEYLGSLDSREIKKLVEADGPASIAAPNRLLFVREGVLYSQRIDVAGASLIGNPLTVASPFQVNSTGIPRISSSNTGVMAFRTDLEILAQARWVDRSGKPLETVGPSLVDLMDATLSPDGRTLAVVQLVNREQVIGLLDVARGTVSRFAVGNRPSWSPDGTRIVFTSSRSGLARIYSQPIGTNDAAELLFESNEAQNSYDWSTDGHILFSSQSAKNARDLWVLSTEGGTRTPTPFVQTSVEERNGAFSPDGRWIAYESDEGGRNVVVRPFSGSEAVGRSWRVSTADGFSPFWRADSKEIYYAGSPARCSQSRSTPRPVRRCSANQSCSFRSTTQSCFGRATTANAS